MKLPEGRRANLTLALASVLVTLVVLVLAYEVAANVRYYRWRASFDNNGWIGRLTVRSPNPALLWEYRPNASVPGLTTNRWGFRDVDHPTTDRPAGIRRIAFVGDSITLGMGVARPETFVHLVEAMALASGQRVQTLNFGVDGYHTLQIRELLTAKVLAFEPHEVVYVMCLNDFDFSDSSGRKISYFRRPWLFLPQDVARRYRSLREVEFHRDHFQRHQDDVFRAVGEMAKTLEARGAGFLLVLVPVFPEEKGDPAYFARYPLLDLHQEILRIAEQGNIPTHDLLDDFRRQARPPQVLAQDVWHLTQEGHRLVAESLYPILIARASS